MSATDPITFAGVPALLLAVAIVASFFPARLAGRVDPNAAALAAERGDTRLHTAATPMAFAFPSSYGPMHRASE